MDRDSNCCVNNKDHNVPLASGEQAASKGPAQLFFSRVLKAAILAPLSCHAQTLWGSAESTDGPGPRVPPPENCEGNLCSADRAPPASQRPAPRAVLLFYLKADSISRQCFGHWNSPTNAQDKPYLFPLTPYRPLTVSFLPFFVLILHLSFGVLAKCWIIIKC